MIELSYVSLFSGIEAFSVAASRVEGVRWNSVFFSEIDPFPCAVLAHHFPNVPNLGDICNIKIDKEKGTITNGRTTIPLPRNGIDILAGGSPCQDVSIAGQRRGMQAGSGTRSSLAFEYARLVEELHPRVILWENVPGVLSSNGGLDFAAFLDTLGKLGYRSLAYRVLDAQYTRVDGFPRGVPQRRKRVWLVGCAGADESVPAQILFEWPGLLGDTPPRREAGKGFACPAGYCVEGNDGVVGGAGFSVGNGQLNQTEPEEVSKTLDTMHDAPMCLTPGHPQTHRVYGADGAAPTVTANENAGQNQQAVLTTNSNGEDVSATLDAKGNSTSGIGAQNDKRGGYVLATFENHAQDSRVKETEVMPTMGHSEANSPGSTGNNPLVIAVRTANTHANGHGVSDEATHTICRASGQAVAVGFFHVASGMMLDCQPSPTSAPLKRSPGGEGAVCVGFKAGQSANGGLGEEAEVSPTMSHQPSALEPTVATMLKVRCGKDTYTKPDGSNGTAGKGPLASEESAFTLAATQDQSLVLRHIVRRLTPTECERLQAFPDGWTRIPYRGKPADQCPDSPRYKALGNSWATNCAEWILRRIVAAIRLGMI